MPWGGEGEGFFKKNEACTFSLHFLKRDDLDPFFSDYAALFFY